MLLTEHNLFYYQDLMRDLRNAIEAGELVEYSKKFKFGQEENEEIEQA
jgi:tRNA-guanine family transglycosylase